MLARFALPTFFRNFDDYFLDPTTRTEAGTRSLWPPADVLESEKAIEINLDLPGIRAEDISVQLENDTLTVSAERPAAQSDGKAWLRQERSFGRYFRTFTLPDTVTANPEAAYRNGVLTLTLPKKEEVKPRSVKVKVEA